MNQVFRINGKTYTKDELIEEAFSGNSYENDYEVSFWSFLKQWFSEGETIIAHTSGSTGKPKQILLRKEHMVNSAKMTLQTLNIKPGESALLCLSSGYIAGKMMIVRALVGNLNLTIVEPKSFFDIEQYYRFCAMVPMQIYTFAKNRRADLLNKLGTIIIGGSAIPGSLERFVRTLSAECYATYGMTETVSHIALRRVNGENPQKSYVPLLGVSVSLNSSKCLTIDALNVCEEPVVTNDIAEINADGSFSILGRADNVINTGGIKVIPELVEQKLGGCTKLEYAISSIPNKKLGEMVVLVIEGEQDCLFNFNGLLSDYERPKKIVKVDKIPQTSNGKIDRIALKKLLSKVSNPGE